MTAIKSMHSKLVLWTRPHLLLPWIPVATMGREAANAFLLTAEGVWVALPLGEVPEQSAEEPDDKETDPGSLSCELWGWRD